MCLCACSLNNPYSSLPTIGEHAVSQTCRERVWPYLLDCICWNLMKSTKVQNPRCIPRIKPIIRAYWPPIALKVLPGQYSLLRRLAASCIVWDKAEPAIRTILHDALNGRVAYVDFNGHAHSRLPGGWVPKLYACALLIIDGLGHATWSSTMTVSRS